MRDLGEIDSYVVRYPNVYEFTTDDLGESIGFAVRVDIKFPNAEQANQTRVRDVFAHFNIYATDRMSISYPYAIDCYKINRVYKVHADADTDVDTNADAANNNVRGFVYRVIMMHKSNHMPLYRVRFTIHPMYPGICRTIVTPIFG